MRKNQKHTFQLQKPHWKCLPPLPSSENKEENCGRRPQGLNWPWPGTPGASPTPVSKAQELHRSLGGGHQSLSTPQGHGPRSWFWLCKAQNRAQGAQPAAAQGPVAPAWTGGSPWAMGRGGGGPRRGRLGRLKVIIALEALKGEKHLWPPGSKKISLARTVSELYVSTLLLRQIPLKIVLWLAMQMSMTCVYLYNDCVYF